MLAGVKKFGSIVENDPGRIGGRSICKRGIKSLLTRAEMSESGHLQPRIPNRVKVNVADSMTHVKIRKRFG